MAKTKRKPDFSKPKPQKEAPELKSQEASSDLRDEQSLSSEESNEQLEQEESPEEEAYRQEAIEAGYDTSKYYVNLPRIVIAGRPNVGKSTLFNRFMHRRLAIVDPTPGVTRSDGLHHGKAGSPY